ncbi:FtsX-like permease family protein [Nocardioides sp. CER19]|uniref:ABC transporter permease n=1 Tax=Nocardioides sp. CER19 TaxID=3038538 RepID=UPI00244AF7A8|nr:FtsX-like permease family protein [Nocardioides sp. CER19]MDH2416593.1 FtsX-like permease family protein [Nocardioides sp. CER19]
MLRLTLRNLFARKLRLVMSALAIVLGVAFLAGVLIFSHGLSHTFDNIIKGSTPDALVRPVGTASFGQTAPSTLTIPPADVARLADLPEVARADGSVDGAGLFLLDRHGKLVGGQGAPTLAFNHSGSPNMLGENILDLRSGRWPQRPDEVLLDHRAAERGGYSVGDTVKVIAPSGDPVRTLHLVGTADFNGGGTAGAILVIFDTAGAQQMFLGGRDVFTTVNLTAADGVNQAQLVAAAKKVLPTGFTAVTGDKVVDESKDAVGQFLGVISTFLLVFAIIAVIVGGFIIVNTFSILVAQRTRELALIRALGASQRQVTGSVLLEALVTGLVATTLGVAVGWGLARALAALFRTFGLDIAGGALTLTPRTIVLSYVVGVLVTLVAAYLPARRAAKVPPVAAMRDDLVPKERSLRRRTLIGAGFLVLGAAIAVVGLFDPPGNDAAWIGVGAVLWILTVAAISAALGRPVLAFCRNVFQRLFGTPGRLAGENALRDPRRTGATASALMIGLALVSLIGVLAASLNSSLGDLVDKQFSADFVVQSAAFTPFPTEVGDQLQKVPGVAVVSRQQMANARLGGIDGDNTFIAANDEQLTRIYDLDVDAGRTSLRGDETFVTKDVADKHGWKVGSRFTLAFPGGATMRPTVVGIIEPNVVTGQINIPLDRLEAAGVQRQDSSLSIRLEPGADAATVHRALDKVVAPLPIVSVQDKQEFGDSIRGQVNQLLFMIYGLLALAIVIAVIGIVNTLGLSVLERTRELGLLRAIGLTRRQLRRMVTLESIAIAVLGAVLGLVIGVLFGVLLRQALADNLTSLGLPLGQLVAFLVVAVVVGVLAAIVPAIRAARLDVLRAIATE